MRRPVRFDSTARTARGVLAERRRGLCGGARARLPSLAGLCLALLIAGCNAGDQPMTRPTPTGTPQFIALEMPTSPPPAQPQSLSPLDPPPAATAAPPTLTPSAPTLPAMPYPQRTTSAGTIIAVTPIPVAPQVVCTPEGETVTCYDDLLDLTFRYPAFMGEVLYTSLRQGGDSGYAYEYTFSARGSAAGGRSSDFGEGRGSMYSDQGGFGGRSSADICAEWQAALCQELGPHALLIGLLPKADRLCTSDMPYPEIPHGILVLDLPQHPLIQGFAFAFPLLGAEDAAEFRDDWYSDEIRCTAENQAALAAYVEQLHQALPAGIAPAEMQLRYDALLDLAGSLQGPYLEGVTAE